MVTLGYGDIYPTSAVTKIATIIQIVFSFGLIAVVLGWVMGHASEENKSNLITARTGRGSSRRIVSPPTPKRRLREKQHKPRRQ
jgi:hypothetical protein